MKIVDYTQLHWQSDWNGYEVGYPEVLVVGLYSDPKSNKSMYIDIENSLVLEEWEDNEGEW